MQQVDCAWGSIAVLPLIYHVPEGLMCAALNHTLPQLRYGIGAFQSPTRGWLARWGAASVAGFRFQGREGRVEEMSANSAASAGSSTCLLRPLMAGPNLCRRPVLGLWKLQRRTSGKFYGLSHKPPSIALQPITAAFRVKHVIYVSRVR